METIFTIDNVAMNGVNSNTEETVTGYWTTGGDMIY